MAVQTQLLRQLADELAKGILTGHDWPNSQDELLRLNSARLMRQAAEELDRREASKNQG